MRISPASSNSCGQELARGAKRQPHKECTERSSLNCGYRFCTGNSDTPTPVTPFRKKYTAGIADSKHLGQFEFDLITCRQGLAQNGDISFRIWSVTDNAFVTGVHCEATLTRTVSQLLPLSSLASSPSSRHLSLRSIPAHSKLWYCHGSPLSTSPAPSHIWLQMVPTMVATMVEVVSSAFVTRLIFQVDSP